MTEYKLPGSLGVNRQPLIDPGTLCLRQSSMPIPAGWLLSATQDSTRQVARMSIAGGQPPVSMSLSAEGIALLKGIEQLHLKPYDDQTGKDVNEWVAGATIGYGHLINKSQWPSYKDGVTVAEADELFAADLAPFQAAVRSSVIVGLQQYQFDALAIFAFNIGVSGFKSSSVVRMINDPVAPSSYSSLESAWKAWSKSQGKVMKGLENRRNSEWGMYTSAQYERW